MTDGDVIERNHLAYRYDAAVDACDVEAFLAVFHPDARMRTNTLTLRNPSVRWPAPRSSPMIRSNAAIHSLRRARNVESDTRCSRIASMSTQRLCQR
jgi:hypothetical protein